MILINVSICYNLTSFHSVSSYKSGGSVAEDSQYVFTAAAHAKMKLIFQIAYYLHSMYAYL